MEWKNIFEEVPDFRRGNVFKLHILSDILLLSLFATLAGAENDEEIETYGREKQSFLSNYLSLPNGIPSHDTITRVFRYLDKDKFAECLLKYSKELLTFLGENHISIDGKVCRATNKGGKKKNGICIITAWAKFLQTFYAQHSSTMTQDFIVVGASMGGLISRFGLAWMEKEGLQHHTSLFISFDSPQAGAQIPLGLQQMVDTFTQFGALKTHYRSEERRVGKEC